MRPGRWLKTVDQYYYGQRNDFTHAGVGYQLDSIVQSLDVNPDRRFTFAEQAFFQRWWNEQTAERRNVTKRLVGSGQLSFVLNGWAQHDEATPHFITMMDQTSLGNRFLMQVSSSSSDPVQFLSLQGCASSGDSPAAAGSWLSLGWGSKLLKAGTVQEFNFTPRVSWQLDPFGHSATQAVLLTAGFGADSMFFGRIDYQDRRARLASRRMEYVWRASPTLGASAQIFAGANLGGSYGPPSGLCWDQEGCNGGDPMIDDGDCEIFEPDNVKPIVDTAVENALEYANGTQGNNVYFMMCARIGALSVCVCLRAIMFSRLHCCCPVLSPPVEGLGGWVLQGLGFPIRERKRVVQEPGQ